MAFGRQLIGNNVGHQLQLTYDGMPQWRPGGITIDWSTIAAVSGSDYTIPVEGTVVPIGQKYLRYGQFMCMITTAHTHVFTPNGTFTSGSVTYRCFRPDTGAYGFVTINTTDSNATATASFEAFYGTGNVTVSGTGTFFSAAHTLTFGGTLAGLIIPLETVGANNIVGGGTAAITVGTGGSTGKFGPYDPSASDGRQTITRGFCGLLNTTILQTAFLGAESFENVDQVGVIIGGLLFRNRALATSGSASLAAGPTYSTLEDGLPGVNWAVY